MHDHPSWLVRGPATDTDLGVLTTGKEAQVNLIQRTGADGATCLIARKRYLPRTVQQKGELEALGVQRASTFRHDTRYRSGRAVRGGGRERRAVQRRSRFGRRLLREQWVGHEYDALVDLWWAGAPVPFPIGHDGDVVDLQYLGDLHGAAPQLHAARLIGDQLTGAYDQVVEGLRCFTQAGWVHGDLSAYNVLWWDSAAWIIDLPQAVEFTVNPDATDLLHRDVVNICTWFGRQGLTTDAEALFADLRRR